MHTNMQRLWALYEVKPSAAELDNRCFHINRRCSCTWTNLANANNDAVGCLIIWLATVNRYAMAAV